ncbi:hypothetical protein G7085_12230 [Tessaracoccus sp. HDW20]|uniref:hypothetical protein n=1 Tax=Tessaracoccus coleopterorum TaxID=2714950 RepID=UPI0018D49A2F|nr:hypothetical protein [Tessaracoccus coleopterorum]NHB85123.1 hypothetical protein [Tessaracoccus coleopterorum]
MLAGRLGFEQPYAGSIGFAIACIALGCVFGLLRVTGRRPRVGSLIGIVVLSTVVLGPAFPPQSGLWVLFAVVVARPTRPALIAVTATQVGYALAHLAWADAVTAGTGVPWVYWFALVARVAVESWLTVAVLFDLLRPARDTVPTAALHDPLAGELSGLPTSGRSRVPAPLRRTGRSRRGGANHSPPRRSRWW